MQRKTEKIDWYSVGLVAALAFSIGLIVTICFSRPARAFDSRYLDSYIEANGGRGYHSGQIGYTFRDTNGLGTEEAAYARAQEEVAQRMIIERRRVENEVREIRRGISDAVCGHVQLSTGSTAAAQRCLARAPD